jgi:hypothetical protein
MPCHATKSYEEKKPGELTHTFFVRKLYTFVLGRPPSMGENRVKQKTEKQKRKKKTVIDPVISLSYPRWFPAAQNAAFPRRPS